MKKIASFGIILDYRRRHKNGTFPVKLRITFDRTTKYYSLAGYKFTQADWDKIHGKKPREAEREIKFELNEIEAKVRGIIKSLPYFSFELFEKKFNEDDNLDREDLFYYFQKKQDELLADKRLNTAETFRSTKMALTKFYKSKKLSMLDISESFLTKWQNHMLSEIRNEKDEIVKKKLSPNTIGIYMRNIRTLYNMAMEDHPGLRSMYPFGTKKYVIPSRPKKIEALSVQQVMSIMDAEVDTEATLLYRDLWVFSYLVNGINIRDILSLKYSNINGNYISFTRKKNEKKNMKKEIVITALLLDEVQEIIQRHGNKPILPDSYIFPFFTKGISEADKQRRVRQAVKMINDYVNRVAEKLEITIRVTTYTARHSFAFRLKEVGAPLELRSECLGHTSIKTTEEFYSRNFSDDKRDVFALQLLEAKGK